MGRFKSFAVSFPWWATSFLIACRRYDVMPIFKAMGLDSDEASFEMQQRS